MCRLAAWVDMSPGGYSSPAKQFLEIFQKPKIYELIQKENM